MEAPDALRKSRAVAFAVGWRMRTDRTPAASAQSGACAARPRARTRRKPARATSVRGRGRLGRRAGRGAVTASACPADARGPHLGASLAEHGACWSDRAFRRSVLQGVLLLIAGLVVNYVAGTYASLHAGRAVRDVLLDRLPTLPVDIVFVDGAFLLWAFVLAILLTAPRTVPFVLKSVSLFIVIRSFFVVLTHLGPPMDEAVLDPNRIMDKLTFAGDLFFSGHTGFPFLLSLIFWENRTLRYILLGAAGIFAVAVLFGHLHYSIDVFAAFFITDSLFRIAQRMFPAEYQMLRRRIVSGRTRNRGAPAGPPAWEQ